MTPAIHLLPFLLSLVPQAADPSPASTSSLAWGDLDGDGLADVLAFAPDGRAALLLNAGDGRFRDHTLVCGVDLSMGVRVALWGDADGDGHLDLLVLGLQGPGRLWRNLGQGTFTEVTEASGLGVPAAAIELAWLDYDRDERPDLAVTMPQGELLFHNAGAGRFERVELLSAVSEKVVVVAAPSASEEPPAPAPGAAGPAGSTQAAVSFTAVPASPPTGGSASASPWCPPSIADSALPGNCIPASTLPMLGALLPLGPELFVGPGGSVGIGTTSPTARLHVAGRILGDADIIAAGQLRSFATGVPPLEVNNSLLVPDLNADLLDGLSSSDFSQLGQTIEGAEVTNGTLTAADLADDSVSSAEIAADAVGSSEIAAGAVGASELANGAVSGIKIQDGSIGAADLSTGAVTGAVIADGAITNADVSASAAIAGSKIQPFFNGPVGIGTTTPAYDLDVEGIMRASDLLVTQRLAANTGHMTNTVVAGTTSGTNAMAAKFRISSSVNPQAALRAETTGLGPAGSFSVLNTASSQPTISAGTLASGPGVYAITYGTGNAGYFEIQNAGSGVPAVYVKTNTRGHGLYAESLANNTTGLQRAGVTGETWGSHMDAVYGIARGEHAVGVLGSSAVSHGVWGDAMTAGQWGVFCGGDFACTGSKNFLQPHPTDPGKEIVFTCLEGNESGTYFRGTAELSGGRAMIEVPEEFRLVTEAEGLSVQLTPVGRQADLWVERQDLEELVVRGDVDVTFHYQVHGLRRGFTGTKRIREAKAFVPKLRGLPYATQFPAALRRILVANGTLNPDLTPNEATAAAQGWTLRDPNEREREMIENAARASGIDMPSTPSAPAATEESSGETLLEEEATPAPHSSSRGKRVPM